MFVCVCVPADNVLSQRLTFVTLESAYTIATVPLFVFSSARMIANIICLCVREILTEDLPRPARPHLYGRLLADRPSWLTAARLARSSIFVFCIVHYLGIWCKIISFVSQILSPETRRQDAEAREYMWYVWKQGRLTTRKMFYHRYSCFITWYPCAIPY